MVSKPAQKRTSIRDFRVLILILIFLLVFVSVFLVFLIISRKNAPSGTDDERTSQVEPVDDDKGGSGAENGGGDHGGGKQLPTRIDFQPIVDEWVNATSGDKSVMIYDLDRSEIVGEYDSTRRFNTASLYKLFVVYEGYRRLETGVWNADDIAGSTRHTILECLDLSIRESYSPCAETLWAMIDHDTLDYIIETEFKIVNSDISSLSSNANDITEMMKLFYYHPGFQNETNVTRMKDSFLNQPATSYDWRQGLPRGISDAINVYNKVGWDYDADGGYWNLYHDAAILETQSGRHFVVVVMTHHVSLTQIRAFGAMIEEAL